MKSVLHLEKTLKTPPTNYLKGYGANLVSVALLTSFDPLSQSVTDLWLSLMQPLAKLDASSTRLSP
ncbi:MAG: hypothetical protein EB089_06255 [Acidimicrobiia bacterium]|nr:hypothetical protein [Actinomycetota bacterium]NDC91440.1 hypothetical protein [Acidimicrobiia bacterium]NDD72307.1 hypothetical protein [Actinomycetota bacterium]